VDNDAPAGRLPRVRRAFPVIGLGGLVIVAGVLIDDSTLFLAYAKALIWPLVVLVVLWWLRDPIRTKAAQLLEIQGAGMAARFAAEEKTEQFSEDVVADVAALASDDVESEERQGPPPPTADPAPSDAKEPPLAQMESPGPDPSGTREQERRRRIERLMDETAAWGWEMAALGFKSPPKPVVTWGDGENVPTIRYARGGITDQSVGLWRQAAAAIEAPIKRRERIDKLEKELKTALGKGRVATDMARRFGLRSEVDVLKSALRSIDPGNPWLDVD
jgi:hypothetical protein